MNDPSFFFLVSLLLQKIALQLIQPAAGSWEAVRARFSFVNHFVLCPLNDFFFPALFLFLLSLLLILPGVEVTDYLWLNYRNLTTNTRVWRDYTLDSTLTIAFLTLLL